MVDAMEDDLFIFFFYIYVFLFFSLLSSDVIYVIIDLFLHFVSAIWMHDSNNSIYSFNNSFWLLYFFYEKERLNKHLYFFSCQYGDRCKFLHVTPQQSKPNAFGFGTQTNTQFQHRNSQQQKPNPFGFGVQNSSQSKENIDFRFNQQNNFKVPAAETLQAASITLLIIINYMLYSCLMFITISIYLLASAFWK